MISAGTAPSCHPDSVTFRHANATEPWLADWDGDGDLDLVTGDHQDISRLKAVEQRERFLELRGQLRELRTRLHDIELDRDDALWRAGYRGPSAYTDSFARMEPLLAREAELVGALEELSTESTTHGLVRAWLRR